MGKTQQIFYRKIKKLIWLPGLLIIGVYNVKSKHFSWFIQLFRNWDEH